MTFEEWFKGNSGFGNFTREELYAEVFPKTMKDLKEELEHVWCAAFEAGWREGHKEGYTYRETVYKSQEGGV
jgi:hypothetical protein